MKLILSSALLLFGAMADEGAVEESPTAGITYDSKPVILMSKALGCYNDCTHEPMNFPQGVGCIAGAKLTVDEMKAVFKCGADDLATACTSRMESTAADAPKCVEFAIPPTWAMALGSSPLCVTKKLGDMKDAIMAGMVAFSPIFAGLVGMEDSSYGKLMHCLNKGTATETSCTAAGGITCAECGPIPAKYFSPMAMPPTKLCLPAKISETACPLIMDTAGDAKRGYCMGKDPMVQKKVKDATDYLALEKAGKLPKDTMPAKVCKKEDCAKLC